MTNGDRIRKMDDEELSMFLGLNSECATCPAHKACHHDSCREAFLEWLCEEAKDE